MHTMGGMAIPDALEHELHLARAEYDDTRVILHQMRRPRRVSAQERRVFDRMLAQADHALTKCDVMLGDVTLLLHTQDPALRSAQQPNVVAVRALLAEVRELLLQVALHGALSSSAQDGAAQVLSDGAPHDGPP